MRNTKFLLFCLAICLLFTSCLKNNAQKLLDSTLDIAGNKFESDWKNFKMIGNYSYCKTASVNGLTPERDGAASFNFIENDLEVHYSAATRMEELAGNVHYEREKYKLTDLELELYEDETNNFRSKKIVGKWDGNKSFYCYLKKYLKGSNKPSLNQQKEVLQSDLYAIRFEVYWGGDTYAFLETTELDSEKQQMLLKLFTTDLSSIENSKNDDPMDKAVQRMIEKRKQLENQ